MRMVGVGMGVEDSVEAGDVVPEGLEPEIRRGVYKYIFTLCMNEKGASCPVVFGISGGTNGARTTDYGDARRSGAPENNNPHYYEFSINRGLFQKIAL
jgi:hypothetical protein